MSASDPWVHDGNAALLTDLYQLTMLQAYEREGMGQEAVFSLFVRRLPAGRNFFLACGLDSVLSYLETLRFSPEALEYLASLGTFSPAFLDGLRDFRFTGDVWAVPEGTPVFAEEPLLEVKAPIAEAQLVESFVMNQIHLQTLAASKAVRVVLAAGGRSVVDFGLRRMHGTDAGMKAARAFYIAGVDATSNILAGQVYGLPVTGTMAHSYIQAHESEAAAFRAFTELYPETVLLVDTYDTLAGVRKVVELARELGDDFRVRALRLDSGDLVELSKQARSLLDEAGLQRVRLFASGGLEESSIADLLARGAKLDAFGVGTAMGVSQDVPALDFVYKLTEYAGEGRLKLSPGKRILPGRKQIFRQEEGERAQRDILVRWGEEVPGRPLLRQVMAGGERLAIGAESLEEIRRRAQREVARLPEPVRALEPAQPPYEVILSTALEAYSASVVEELRATE